MMKNLTQAKQLRLDCEFDAAIKLLQDWIVENPNHADAIHEIGLCLVQQGNMKSAIAYFQRVVQLEPQNAVYHTHLGNALKALNDYDSATVHYECALKCNPKSAHAHNNFAAILALQNRYQEALHHYACAVNIEPEFVLAHYNLGLLLLKNNESDAAAKQFQNVLALHPENLDAHFYRGVLHLKENQLKEAEEHFSQVVHQDNEHINALINLGVTFLKQEKNQLAIDYFTKALSIDTENIEARNNLAATFIHHDRFENALIHYIILLKKEPLNIEYLYNAGVAQMALGYLKESRMTFESLLTQNTQHFDTLVNLAAINSRLGDKPSAIRLLQQAKTINPRDIPTQYMLNALTGKDTEQEACPLYVSNLFDRYALTYEKHLQDTLQYSLTYTIAQLLHQHLGSNKIQKALDLGCGTGLMGEHLCTRAAELIGIDLSAKMLDIAKKKAIYTDLIKADIVTYLHENKKEFELIVAADTLPYLGELSTLFAHIHDRLARQGIFIFSTEISENKPWKLQTSARFSHSVPYILSLCRNSGFTLLHQEKTTARIQDNKALEVMLYMIQKP